ncbi:MAG: hypothetical protein Q9207_001619 [Kuettlingeria erythrocarpa]
MATASLNPSCSGLRDNGSTETGILPSKTGLADQRLEWKRVLEASIWRCDSVCTERQRTPVRGSSPQSTSWPQLALSPHIRRNVRKIELLGLVQDTLCPVVEPPPPYTSTVTDAPPSYGNRERPQRLSLPQRFITGHVQHDCQAQSHTGLPGLPPPIYSMKPIQIDLEDSSAFRQAKGKGAAKKAQKQADQAKWADDGGDNANEGGNAGDNTGGGGGGGAGGGGGSNNGDGGAGDDGGGWDDWNTGGGKKNKKKGKKGKNGGEEEEKEKEEEEEKKNKEANGGAGANDLAWMDDTAAKPDDEWEGFTSTDKKGKKNKKGKAEVVPEPTYNAFQDINLGGDTPQLDLNFATDTATKGFGSGGFGAGGFSSSFDTGNTWGFAGLGNGATDITDSMKDPSADDGGGWGFGKKSKKTTTSSGFDFGNFATLDEGGEVQENVGGDQDDWATGFTATSKKNSKKSKKGVTEGTSTAADVTAIGTAVTDATPADDSWSPWGTSSTKKDKNKKKKNEPEPNEIPPLPPPPPPIPEEPPAEDTWSSFGGAKGKKKNKKVTAEEPAKIEEPIVVVPEPEAEADAGWGAFSTTRDKKKGKKEVTDDKKAVPDPVVVVGDVEAETKAEDNFDWGLPSKKDKDKKKAKKGVEEEALNKPPIVDVPENGDSLDLGWGGFVGNKDKKKKATSKIAEPAIVAVPDPVPEAGAGWGGFGLKKEKKKGKKAIEEVEPQDDDIVAIVEDPDPISGAGWGAFETKDKDKKKSKASATEDFGDDSHVIDVPDFEPIVEDSFDTSWGTTTTKKGKKDKKGAITEVKEDVKSAVGSLAAAEAATKFADDEFMGWGGGSTDKKKDKKGKKGTAEAKKEEALPPPPPPPPVPVPEEPAPTDTWGTAAKKEKKGKKGKVIEPEPAIVEVPDLLAATLDEPLEEEWGDFGLSAKDKKKKEKEKKDKEKEEKAKKEQEQLEREEKDEAEKLEKEEKEKEKEKPKPGKKGKTGTATASSKTKDLMAGSVPDAAPAAEDDFSSSMWGATKKDSKKKSSKKDSVFEVPPPVPTPPAQGFTPPPEDPLDDLLGDDWGNFGTANDKSKNDPKKSSKAVESRAGKSTVKGKADEEKAQVESAAKAAKSFWGAPSKSKTTKDKISDKDKKETDVMAEDDLDLDEIVDIIEEEPPPKKGSKSKTADSRLAKTPSKEEKASKSSSASEKKAKADAEMNALIDLDDIEAKDSKSKTAEATKSKDDDKKADSSSWGGFWGSSKKPTGKKGDEPKKEINKQEAANHSDPLAFLSNEPEPSLVADEPAQSQAVKSSKPAMSASKTSAKLSVAQKVKALEDEKKKVLEPPAPPPPPVVDIEPPAKKTSAANNIKSRGITPSKLASASRKKDLFPPAEEEKKKSKDSVPGGFPDDEENLIDMLASSPPVEKKPAKKSAKTVKKDPVTDMMDVDVPVVPAAPPTPPAEPSPAKPAKKERARVVRDQGASSWGFWGAAPKQSDKKGAKAKDDADVPPSKKTVAPALVRSKSTKTPKEKDKEIEKSSSSDSKEKKVETRPSKSRGSSFGAFFGAPPPARAKPTRRVSTSAASKTTSKRQSMDIDAFGLPSPPPEDSPAAFGKAAKVMGTSAKLDRKASTKGKQKAPLIPDPYPIDDDDMVMVNELEDPIINAPIPRASKTSKEKSSNSKSRREPKPTTDAMDDVVMVDGPSLDDPEPLAFDEKPRGPAPLQRSATSAKKPQSGKLMGLFGGFSKTRRNSETLERPRNKAAVTDDEALSPRKRTVTGREDSSKRIRRDDRKVRRSDKTDRDTEGFITDALHDGGAATELDDAEIRRQERRAKGDAREPDDRRARRRDAERGASEEPRKGKTSERRPRPADDRAAKESSDRAKHSSSRPHKSDRRRSYMEPPSTGERPKAHRSRTEQTSKRRHPVAVDGGVGDYLDTRNAAAEGSKNNEPYMHGANDHTSSWVKSQLSDPADPPPVEGTVIEATPELGGKGGYAKDDDEARRAARKARRQSRYGAEDEAGETDRERRRRRKDKGSEGSAAEWAGKEREKLSRRYTDMGGVRLDSGRPSLAAAGKRGSWLKKVTGLGMG